MYRCGGDSHGLLIGVRGEDGPAAAKRFDAAEAGVVAEGVSTFGDHVWEVERCWE